jgi:hypothetical protein
MDVRAQPALEARAWLVCQEGDREQEAVEQQKEI